MKEVFILFHMFLSFKKVLIFFYFKLKFLVFLNHSSDILILKINFKK